MPTLAKDQRNLLAKVVIQARDSAEVGAKKALHSLGVDEPDAPSHLTTEQRELRRALRAQARQLGDGEDPQKPGTYSIWHLMEKIAYDQWHRMLFARFLAENNLLISPQHQVAVTLDECNDLAPELGLRDGWDVAARFAAEMLPQIFRADDPAGQITLAPEDRSVLQQYVTVLPSEIFISDDALGWVYQFWQEKRKDEVNKSEKKIGADELAPVTQLFTEDYMVLFMLHNTLGAWWAGKKLDKLNGLATEEDCRKALEINGIEWTYLRFIKDEKTSQWHPAAGTFDGWPKAAKELRVLDPCMGSGHFLAFMLPIVIAFRIEEEGLSKPDACDAVLRDNLFGLELDMRCTQIGAFNIAITAWKMVGYRALPSLNVACCGLRINASKEEWLKLSNGDERLRSGLDKLYDLFQQAPVLGSLINPATIQASNLQPKERDLFTATFSELQPLMEKALSKENKDDTVHEMAVTARGLAKAAEILAGKFTLVTTNVPYLGRGKQDEVLKEYCYRMYPDAKADLATCFVERCLGFCEKDGSTALVSTQYWLFLTTYKKLRERLFKECEWDYVIRLGTNAFETISGEVVNVALLVHTRASPTSYHNFIGLDVSGEEFPLDKAAQLPFTPIVILNQQKQLCNPNSKLVLQPLSNAPPLEAVAIISEGLHTGDYPRFGRKYWELPRVCGGWFIQQGGVTTKNFYSGMEHILFWEKGEGELIDFVRERLGTEIVTQWIKGDLVWGKCGVAIGMMDEMKPSLYQGVLFTHGICVIVPKIAANTAAIRTFCESGELCKEVRKLDQKICAARDSVAKVPFDLDYWQKIAKAKFSNGLPKPFSNDPTQWLFNGHPKGSNQSLQVAVARLLCYRWPRQTGSSFPDCPALGPDRLEELADDDGIVCISAIKGEQPAAERLKEVLAAAFDSVWNADKQAELLKQVDFEGKNLEDWLRNGFFEQHCQLFHQRPFIWHIWDGRKDGFSALVNYHKLDKSTLEKLTYTYLGDWITRQKAAIDAGDEGSDARLVAAQELKGKLEKIIEGEPPYDIFIRWKPIEKQPIGWEPDLNDGVRLNIRPFIIANVLRKNPKINWNKDRGKDVQSAPWFHVFKGDRINDHHLTIAEKRKARERS